MPPTAVPAQSLKPNIIRNLSDINTCTHLEAFKGIEMLVKNAVEPDDFVA